MFQSVQKSICRVMAGVLLLTVTALPAQAASANKVVKIGLWHASSDKASMGNIATDHNQYALYNPEKETLQVATNPVNVSGYMSAVTKAQYDMRGDGAFADVKVLSTAQVDTGTKNDGTSHTLTYLSSFEITLPKDMQKTGIAYVPFRMAVPHTPMDAAVGTGYLDARLRIDWATAEHSDLTQIMQNPAMSSGAVQPITRKDAETGIVLVADTAKISAEAAFSAKRLTSGANYDAAKKAAGDAAKSFAAYSLRLTSGAADEQPKGAVEITFPYAGEVLVYRMNADGTKTVQRGTSSAAGYKILTTRIGDFALIGGQKIESGSFSDIKGHWAAESILRAVDRGLFSGTSQTTFGPNEKMTSGMVITVMYRMHQSPAVTVPASIPNVAPGAWYEKGVAWGLANGLIGDYGVQPFHPSKNVTREELSTILFRSLKLTGMPVAGNDLRGFADAEQISPWAKEALAWANAAGIVFGRTEAEIAPQGEATRAEVASMLCRYLDHVEK